MSITKETIKIILMILITVILAVIIACFVSDINVSQSKFNNPEILISSEYQSGAVIFHLETMQNREININNEVILLEDIRVIPDTYPQKLYTGEYTYEVCDDEILIGERNCTNHISCGNIAFLHEDVSSDINKYYERLELTITKTW